MRKEISNLMKNKTWVLVEKPANKRIVGCKWIYRKKEGIPGVEATRYKARLVAKGFTQVEGVDFNEIYSPVVKHYSIRILLAIVAFHDLELEQLDVKTAFLHGDLEETIYMSQPEGFIKEEDKNKVCLLKKTLYGLRQSPRQWYLRFHQYIEKVGFVRSKFDSCVYIRRNQNYTYLLLYVDDILIASKDRVQIQKIKEKLSVEFEMKDLGAAKRILGMDINRNRTLKKLYLSQKTFLEKVLERFFIHTSKPVTTPLAQHFKLSSTQSPTTDEERLEMSKVPYANAVGSLMYCMVCSRPDLAYAISMVSRFMSDPGTDHWTALKWL